MGMGYKICKHSMSATDLKKLLFITTGQYFVDSLYAIGANIPIFNVFTTLVLNLYSFSMVFFILF
jgi:hypothetical protein